MPSITPTPTATATTRQEYLLIVDVEKVLKALVPNPLPSVQHALLARLSALIGMAYAMNRSFGEDIDLAVHAAIEGSGDECRLSQARESHVPPWEEDPRDCSAR